VVAAEVMIVTPTIRDLILESRVGDIREFIAGGRDQYGMQTFDQHLLDLVSSGTVSYEVAHAASTRPADFELQVNMFRRSSGSVPAVREQRFDGALQELPGLEPSGIGAGNSGAHSVQLGGKGGRQGGGKKK
jgi:twitching motility protein PilT